MPLFAPRHAARCCWRPLFAAGMPGAAAAASGHVSPLPVACPASAAIRRRLLVAAAAAIAGLLTAQPPCDAVEREGPPASPKHGCMFEMAVESTSRPDTSASRLSSLLEGASGEAHGTDWGPAAFKDQVAEEMQETLERGLGW